MNADSSSAGSRNVDLENLEAKNYWRLNTEQAPTYHITINIEISNLDLDDLDLVHNVFYTYRIIKSTKNLQSKISVCVELSI